MRCSLCGMREATKRIEFSDNFVDYGLMFAGGMACDVCYNVVKNFRKSSWILEGDSIKELKREELLRALRESPPGSLIYIKSRGQKLSFIQCLRYRSTGAVAALCGEEEGAVLAPKERVREYIDFAVKAYEALGKKTYLAEGCPPSVWAEREELCRRVEELRGDPLWSIVVRAL